MENLYEETLGILKENGKTENDVIWFGRLFQGYDFYNYENCDIIEYPREKFKVFLNFEYDSGFGGQEVDEYLYVVGDNWWLERHEYDGAEWWEYKTLPTRPTKVSNDFY